MKTGELCIRTVVTATADEPVREAAARMIAHHVGCLVVVDDSTGAVRPTGIVTDRDLVRALATLDLGHTRAPTVGDVMTRALLTGAEDDDALDSLERMRARGVRRLPVVDAEGALVGILTFDDLSEWLSGELSSLTRLVRNEQRRERARAGT